MRIFKYLSYKEAKNNFSFYISSLGTLPRHLYKQKLAKIMNKQIDIKENYLQLPKINSYEEYLQIFDFLPNINESWDKNIVIKIDVKLTDALKGNSIKILYDQIIKCTECSTNKNLGEKCKFCLSSGITKSFGINTICPYCKCYGFHTTNKCSTCHSKLLYRRKNQVDLKLGSEFHEGITYSFPNSGNYDIFSGQYGALKVKPVLISEKINNRIELKVVNDSQIESEEELLLSTMALGGTHKVTHALGTCEILIEPCTQPGDYKVINNIGIPIYFDKEENEMHKGSQILFFNVKVPDKEKVKNNLELKKLFQELSRYDNLEELNKLNKMRNTN